jgi:hypothetical protein
VLPKPGRRYFRHEFTLPTKDIDKAAGLLSVDHSFVLHVNGQEIRKGNDWRTVHQLRLHDVLQPGQNLIAIEGENEGELPNPAGILFSLQVTFADGSQETIVSNPDWKSTNVEPASAWTTLAFDDTSWDKVRRYARFNRSHWGQLLDFRHQRDQPRLPFARASLVTLDPFMKALGRPTRENVTTRRDDQATLLQALELTNGSFFNQALQEGAGYWTERLGSDPDALVSQMYYMALGRLPTDNEKRTALEFIGDPVDQNAVQDLLWAVLMLPEFQLIY